MRTLMLAGLLLCAQEDVQKLVNELKSDEIEVREKAEKKLLEIGEKAVAALERELPHADAETRARIKNVIATLKAKAIFKGAFAGRPKAAEIGRKEFNEASRKALGWLARHQSKSGAWATTTFTEQCGKAKCAPAPGTEDYDAGVTAMAVAAFLGAGYSPLSKEKEGELVIGNVVKAGLDHLVKSLDKEGFVTRNQKYIYAQAWTVLALSEAAAICGPKSEWLDPAKKAAQALMVARNKGAGWRYSTRCGDNDTSVTMNAVQALFMAKAAGIEVDDKVFSDVRDWLDTVTDDTHRVGYTFKGTGKVFIPGMNEDFDHHETLTMGAAVARAFTGSAADEPALEGAMAFANRDVPAGQPNARDYYYWYWGALAVWQVEGPKKTWALWETQLLDVVVGTQKQEGCAAGSWEPDDRWSGEGGRIYATAINALTLQTQYRYARILEKK